MIVKSMNESAIYAIGHAFGYYDYGEETGMVYVCEKYQGQGYMRKVMDIAFVEGNCLHVPVILETDARSKCDKYVHLGMELAGTRDLGEFGKMYDLIKYPDAVPAEAKS